MAQYETFISIIVDASGQLLRGYVQYHRNCPQTTKMIDVLR
jgi:hypothetical protein